uniref:Variant surface glycoprotein 1125.1424 n=1 Tax=Trypanosoma brucei TaxID=5691 RepID=A0A1J0R739_9TRYP|nr:variant surface glycoprotein 1125.1424 [Trypanosoma brucei]
MHITLCCLASIFWGILRHGKAADGDEIAALQPLCLAWAAATHGKINTEPDTGRSADYADLMSLNATTWSTEWRSMFDSAAGNQGWEQYKGANKAAMGNIDWTSWWEEWKTAHESTKDDSKEFHKKHNTKTTKQLTEQQKHFINATAAKARKLQEEITKPAQTGTTPLPAEINKLLDDALCTATLATQPQNPTCADVETKDKPTTCTTEAAGKSLALDISCLCAVEHGTDSCHQSQDIQANVLSTNSFNAKVLQTAVEQCPNSLGSLELDDAITQALTTLHARLEKPAAGQKKFLLGATHSTNACTATNAACVDYTDKLKKNRQGPGRNTLGTETRGSAEQIQAVQKGAREKSSN